MKNIIIQAVIKKLLHILYIILFCVAFINLSLYLLLYTDIGGKFIISNAESICKKNDTILEISNFKKGRIAKLKIRTKSGSQIIANNIQIKINKMLNHGFFDIKIDDFWCEIKTKKKNYTKSDVVKNNYFILNFIHNININNLKIENYKFLNLSKINIIIKNDIKTLQFILNNNLLCNACYFNQCSLHDLKNDQLILKSIERNTLAHQHYYDIVNEFLLKNQSPLTHSKCYTKNENDITTSSKHNELNDNSIYNFLVSIQYLSHKNKQMDNGHENELIKKTSNRINKKTHCNEQTSYKSSTKIQQTQSNLSHNIQKNDKKTEINKVFNNDINTDICDEKTFNLKLIGKFENDSLNVDLFLAVNSLEIFKEQIKAIEEKNTKILKALQIQNLSQHLISCIKNKHFKLNYNYAFDKTNILLKQFDVQVNKLSDSEFKLNINNNTLTIDTLTFNLININDIFLKNIVINFNSLTNLNDNVLSNKTQTLKLDIFNSLVYFDIYFKNLHTNKEEKGVGEIKLQKNFEHECPLKILSLHIDGFDLDLNLNNTINNINNDQHKNIQISPNTNINLKININKKNNYSFIDCFYNNVITKILFINNPQCLQNRQQLHNCDKNNIKNNQQQLSTDKQQSNQQQLNNNKQTNTLTKFEIEKVQLHNLKMELQLFDFNFSNFTQGNKSTHEISTKDEFTALKQFSLAPLKKSSLDMLNQNSLINKTSSNGTLFYYIFNNTDNELRVSFDHFSYDSQQTLNNDKIYKDKNKITTTNKQRQQINNNKLEQIINTNNTKTCTIKNFQLEAIKNIYKLHCKLIEHKQTKISNLKMEIALQKQLLTTFAIQSDLFIFNKDCTLNVNGNLKIAYEKINDNCFNMLNLYDIHITDFSLTQHIIHKYIQLNLTTQQTTKTNSLQQNNKHETLKSDNQTYNTKNNSLQQTNTQPHNATSHTQQNKNKTTALPSAITNPNIVNQNLLLNVLKGAFNLQINSNALKFSCTDIKVLDTGLLTGSYLHNFNSNTVINFLLKNVNLEKIFTLLNSSIKIQGLCGALINIHTTQLIQQNSLKKQIATNITTAINPTEQLKKPQAFEGDIKFELYNPRIKSKIKSNFKLNSNKITCTANCSNAHNNLTLNGTIGYILNNNLNFYKTMPSIYELKSSFKIENLIEFSTSFFMRGDFKCNLKFNPDKYSLYGDVEYKNGIISLFNSDFINCNLHLEANGTQFKITKGIIYDNYKNTAIANGYLKIKNKQLCMENVNLHCNKLYIINSDALKLAISGDIFINGAVDSLHISGNTYTTFGEYNIEKSLSFLTNHTLNIIDDKFATIKYLIKNQINNITTQSTPDPKSIQNKSNQSELDKHALQTNHPAPRTKTNTSPQKPIKKEEQKTTGQFELSNLDTSKNYVIQPSTPKKTEKTANTHTCDLNLSVKQFKITGSTLDLNVLGDLKLRKDKNEAPFYLDGKLKLKNGYFDLFATRVQFTNATLIFAKQYKFECAIYLSCIKNLEDLIINLQLIQKPKKPIEFNISSTPYIDKDAILSKLIFKKDLKDLQPLEIAQIAAVLFSLKQNNLFTFLSKIKSIAFFDTISFSQSENNNNVLSLGKFINDNIFIGFEKEENEKPNVKLQMELNKNLSLAANSNSEVGINWRTRF